MKPSELKCFAQDQRLVANTLLGLHFLHRLELAQTAACAFLQSAAIGLQHADSIDIAQLVQTGAIRKALLETKARAAVRKGIPINFATRHFEVDCAIVDNL